MSGKFKRCIAILSALAVVLSFAACGNKKQEQETTSSDSLTVNQNGTAQTTESDRTEETPTDEHGETVSAKEQTTAKEQGAQGQSQVTQNGNGVKPGTTVKKTSSVPQSKADIISYCNASVNKVKSAKPGYNKLYVMRAEGDVSGLPSWLVSLVKKNEKKTVKKGENSNDLFPASGYNWSSKLTERDVAKADISVSGSTYIIKLSLGTEKNPSKGDTSSYGRCMSVIDAADARNMSSAIKSVDMTYHGGYLYAEINSKTGNLIKAEFSASADIDADIKLLGNVKVKDVVSTETFTNFVW